MNKVLLVGRLTHDPTTKTTQSNIKYTRFSVAVDRTYGENQADFIPVVAWRNQADFVDKYFKKGARVSVEGKFTSSRVQKPDEQSMVTFYEVTADRVELLESKSESQARANNSPSKPAEQNSATATQVMKFEKEAEPAADEELKEVPWELDL